MKKPELLSPAGSRKAMQYAFAYGADAVYVGQPRYSLRVRENEFNKIENIAEAIADAHTIGKKVYIASNLAPHNNKVKTYLRDMEPVIAMNPDALIMSDPGLIMMVREKWPDVPVHLSVQANAVNYATVKFWKSMGLTRIILSRELSLDEVKEIRQECPDIELEVFVHGALCIAYSGRCLLSGYMNHRDSNQGACTNACRWGYQTAEAKETLEGDIVPLQTQGDILASDKGGAQTWEPSAQESEKPAEIDKPGDGKLYLLQEKGRPGELMPAWEDEHGTYIMNSRDLRAVQHVAQLTAMGIDSLKIEGRTKSHFYVARTAQIYRQAIEDASIGRDFNMGLMDQLESLANRGYTEGFYRRHVPEEMQNYEKGNSISNKQQFVAEVLRQDGNHVTVDVKNKITVGDELEVMSSAGNQYFRLENMLDKNGHAINVAPGSGHQVTLQLPEALAGSHGLIMKSLDKPILT